ncbi:MAG: hypothetical protein H7144_00460 [Burkholderiales bacterium]|nr:hypothetical protein [Phycisphaerae bacterium]
MKHRTRIGTTLLINLFALTCLAAPSTQPVALPYAPDRAPLLTRSSRLEWNDDARNRSVPAKIYSPASGNGPFPVIIFSHGLGGSSEGYEFIGRQWAANGYIVVHLQHKGSDDKVWRGQANPGEALKRAANAENSVARARDVSFVIDQLTQLNDQPEWKGRLDLEHIGMSGHSFGGQTTMLIAGEKLGGNAGEKLLGKLSDPRVKAALPMSPATPRHHDKLDEEFGAIKIPVFEMTGTLDVSPLGETTAADRRIPFDHMNDHAAYLLTLTDGDHMVFSGRARRQFKPTDARHHEIIRISSTGFWDAYLKDDTVAKAWLRDGAFKTSLAGDGAFEQK